MTRTLNRRHILRTISLPLMAASGRSVWAQSYPSKQVRILVGAAPGGPVDFMARVFGDLATPVLGQTFLVDNRPGASGTLAAAAAAKAPADGYTLMASGPGAVVVAPHIFAKLDYDPTKDFVPVCMMGAGAFVLAVHPSVPVANVQELIAFAKSHPGALSYGSGGNGSSGQLCAESFAARSGVDFLHVPYKGDAPAINDLLGGQLKMMFTAPNVAWPHMKSGKLKVLAVTSQERMASIPEVPSVHETLNGFEYLGWVMMFAPSATPQTVIDTLANYWSKARQDPAVKAKLEGMGMYPPARYATREAILALFKSEKERTAQLVKKLGITPS